MITYCIQCSGYDILSETLEHNMGGFDETYCSASRARETIESMLQYMPNSLEYDIRFANDTVLVLSVLQRNNEGYWKPCDKNVYVAASDMKYAKTLRLLLKGKTIVPVQKKGKDLTTETVLPLSIELAKEIQCGKKEGYITKKRGTERWQLMQVAGTEDYILRNTEGCNEYIPLKDLNVPGVFVIHLVTRIPGIPENLAGKTPFTYQGIRFIPAGQFKDFGIDTTEKKFWRAFADHTELDPNRPVLPCWDYDSFYRAVPKEERDNDVFWAVEKGIYVCPANQPFKFKP